jgi:putative NADPH-quinone reductase
MSKKILIVQGHPNPTSYCSALADLAQRQKWLKQVETLGKQYL